MSATGDEGQPGNSRSSSSSTIVCLRLHQDKCTCEQVQAPVGLQHGLVQRDEGSGGPGHRMLIRVHECALPPCVPRSQAAARLEAEQIQPCMHKHFY